MFLQLDLCQSMKYVELDLTHFFQFLFYKKIKVIVFMS